MHLPIQCASLSVGSIVNVRLSKYQLNWNQNLQASTTDTWSHLVQLQHHSYARTYTTVAHQMFFSEHWGLKVSWATQTMQPDPSPVSYALPLPECHIPGWSHRLSQSVRSKRYLQHSKYFSMVTSCYCSDKILYCMYHRSVLFYPDTVPPIWVTSSCRRRQAC